MSWRARVAIAGAVLAVILALVLATSAPPAPTPNPPGTFSFAVLGDAPYYLWEEVQYRLVLESIASHDLSWVLHVGDIFWHPCTDELYRRSLAWFDGLPHPVIYTPGDNEWVDCWERGSGRFDPQERLARIRQIFFADPGRSLGGRRLPLLSQGGRGPFPEFVENVRWTHEGITFATVHIVGSMNGLEPALDRAAADRGAARRTAAATEWVRETFAEAGAAVASAVVIGFHGNPSFEEPVGDRYRRAFEPFLAALEEEVERFRGPVLAVHGDHHEYTVDHPLVRRTTGRRLDNFTRLQVPGSPRVGWVRIGVRPGAEHPFTFEPHVVPRWRYW